MFSENFLFYALAIGFLILVGFASHALYSLSKTLNKLTSILNKVDDIASDAEDVKNGIKSGILYLMKMFVKKGGGKNGK
ncbi:MAG TPA: DUF948 domain-containing protein [Patescibacteria group bacterium]|nr:DUF948 domain-containing protein [Patescibacteria group bacterium]